MDENYFNTWEYVVETRREIQGVALDLEWQIALERFFHHAGVEYRGEEFRAQFDFGELTPVETIPRWICMELNPPPEILQAFSKSLSTYLDRPWKIDAGYEVRKVSLEEAIFGKPVKGVGNYADRKLSRVSASDYEPFHRFVLQQRDQGFLEHTLTTLFDRFQQHKKDIREASTGGFMEEDDEINSKDEAKIDAESYLRGYRRWRKKNSNE